MVVGIGRCNEFRRVEYFAIPEMVVVICAAEERRRRWEIHGVRWVPSDFA